MRLLLTLLLLALTSPGFAQTALGSYATGKAVYASPTLLSDGAIVCPSNDGYVYCLSHGGAAFTLRWKTLLPNIIDSSVAVSRDGTLYVGCFDAKVYALNPATGAILWSYTTGGFVAGSPAVASDGTIYVCSGDGLLHAINPNGSAKWTHNVDAASDPYPTLDLVLEGTPAIASNGTIYYGTNDGRVVAVSSAGTTLWTYATPNAGTVSTSGEGAARIKSAPAISSTGNIHVVTGAGYLVTLLPTGALYWEEALVDSSQNIEASDSSPIVDSLGNIYTASRLGYVYAYTSSGTALWSKALGDIYYSSGCLDSNGRLYYVYYDGAVLSNTSKLICMNAVSGTILWTTTAINGVVDSSPVISAEGKIFFGGFGVSATGTSYHNIYAYQAAAQLGVTATLGATSWPCFGRSHSRTQRFSASAPPAFSGSSSALLTGGRPSSATLALSTTGWHGYQWRKSTINPATGAITATAQISGQTAAGLYIASPVRSNAGIYDCLVSNDAGQRYSPKTYVAVLESLTPGTGGFTAITYQPVLLTTESFVYQYAPDFKTWTNTSLTSIVVGVTDTATATTKRQHTLTAGSSAQQAFRWKVTAP